MSGQSTRLNIGVSVSAVEKNVNEVDEKLLLLRAIPRTSSIRDGEDKTQVCSYV